MCPDKTKKKKKKLRQLLNTKDKNVFLENWGRCAAWPARYVLYIRNQIFHPGLQCTEKWVTRL